MLTIHHLGRSQSERIVWLCEELGLPYDLRLYARDPVTILAPPELQARHPIGAALEAIAAQAGRRLVRSCPMLFALSTRFRAE